MDLLTILPNLSIGVVSILALVYLSNKFLKRLEDKDGEFIDFVEKKDKKHEEERSAHAVTIRELEKEVRTNIMTQLSENTHAFKKVIDHIEKMR